jgi:hypothetical protein
MKHFAKSFLSLALLSTVALVQAGDSCCGTSTTSTSTSSCSTSCGCTPHTMFSLRSVGDNVAREMVPYSDQFTDCFNGGFGVSVGYQRTFDGHRIARCIFGSETLNFSGSKVAAADRGANDLLSDYFGMSSYSEASISFKPRIQNFIADFNLYLGFDEWINGLYFRVNAPLAWSKWSLESGCSTSCSTPTTTSTFVTTPFAAGYMDQIGTDTPTTQEALTALATPAVSTLALALDGQTSFGDKTTNWTFGRFGTGCNHSQWKLADVDMMLGWNFWHCDDYHVGIYAKAVAPTGTKIDAKHQKHVFSPVIGNNKHWELGGGMSAHAQLWNCEDTQSLTLYFDGNLTHMFKNHQVRSFDFTGKGAMSRYMLLKEFGADQITYTGHLVNAIDYATRCATVRVDVKGEAALKLVYTNCNWNMGLGYDFYGISKEKVCIGKTASALTGYYGFKGTAAVDALGYTTTVANITTATPLTSYVKANFANDGFTLGLDTTQSTATINSGVICSESDAPIKLYRAGVSPDAGFIYVCPTAETITSAATKDASTLTAAYESAEAAGFVLSDAGLVTATDTPVIITSADLDKHSGAASSQIVSKVFGTLGYSWNDCDWKPFLDLGAEWDLTGSKHCCSAKQWGLWLKGGISF